MCGSACSTERSLGVAVLAERFVKAGEGGAQAQNGARRVAASAAFCVPRVSVVRCASAVRVCER